MKKYILLLVFASAVISCQKYRPGGNLDNLKLTDSVAHYTDEHAEKSTYVEKIDTGAVKKPNLIEPDLMMKKQTAAEPATEVAK
ncbi:hypothetical protein [Halpernia frigidisoli]|uniref:Uncharacterized protein n=1 Tax=Halpernia frigidisoli TaxID=1125876 RepID=A0A1I3DZ58_9FLAO|nr:hypothetical protein [Halpernia frigidisoli]SFH92022.1 hypothetical protein SAMN05443292_0787 [Halpernia frigidisoli]